MLTIEMLDKLYNIAPDEDKKAILDMKKRFYDLSYSMLSLELAVINKLTEFENLR